MNALQLALLMRSAGSGNAPAPPPPPVTPPPSPTTTRVGLGLNTSSWDYGTLTPGPMNTLQGGTGFLVYSDAGGANGPAPLDTDGWPTTDFRAGPYMGPESGAPYQVTVSWNGQATVQWLFVHPNAGALSSVAYDAPTNKSTVTFTYSPAATTYPPTIQFGSTKRTAASATGTGLTNLDWRATSLVGSTLKWRPEVVNYFKDFASVLRTMDLQVINHDLAAYTWTTRQKGVFPGTVENCVALANETGCDLWMQIPTGATADWDNNAFAYVNANLASTNKLYFGYSNETWNGSFAQMHQILQTAAAEVHGAIGSEGSRSITSIFRSGNIVTIATSFSLEVTVGQHISVTDGSGKGFGGVYAVATRPSPTTLTYNQVGGNDSIASGVGSNVFFVCTETVAAGTLGAGDNVYGFASNWATRRLLQAAERCRTVVGDGAMLTRYRPILESWASGDQSNGAQQLGYATYYLNLIGIPWATQKHVYGVGGAPYYQLGFYYYCNAGDSCPVQTQQYFLDGWLQRIQSAPSDYRYSAWASVARGYGVKLCYYEGGADSDFDAGTTNNARINAAKLSSTFAAAHLTFLKTMHTSGCDLFMHYNAQVRMSGRGTWGYTDSLTNVTPYWQTFRDYRDVLLAEITPAPPPPSSGVVLTVGSDPWLVGTDPMTTG